jgi:hypothetical protein
MKYYTLKNHPSFIGGHLMRRDEQGLWKAVSLDGSAYKDNIFGEGEKNQSFDLYVEMGKWIEVNPLNSIQTLISPIRANCLGKEFRFRAERDNKNPNGRYFIQCCYNSKCSVSGEEKEWHGRKWYLSEHMTEDEIVKTCFAAFKAAVEHEVMEGFTYEGGRVFNPHVSFRSLLKISKEEVFRA